jgi:tRNA pseudouridine13 synthase
MKPYNALYPDQLVYAFGGPCVSGKIRTIPEDFQVDEIPGFSPDGKGDHVYLTIRKTGLTTNAVARKLRDFCKVQSRDIGYAGMKDKHAVTTQTFSINLAGIHEPDWSEIESDSIKIIKTSRHPRKLKRGVLKGNRFKLVIRELEGNLECVEQRLQEIKKQGVPNYFGVQRFGNNGANIEKAWRLFNQPGMRVKRDERSILFSSVRSMLFNALLSERVKQDIWSQLLEGEVINLDGTERHFLEAIDEVLIKRASELDVHPTGPLPGIDSRAIRPAAVAGEIETAVLNQYQEWFAGLENFRLEHARRALRIAVRNLEWQLNGNALTLAFDLTSGAYATVVLRELLNEQFEYQAPA